MLGARGGPGRIVLQDDGRGDEVAAELVLEDAAAPLNQADHDPEAYVSHLGPPAAGGDLDDRRGPEKLAHIYLWGRADRE